jgi:uncharacterized protein YndB with AHSA1/START domain
LPDRGGKTELTLRMLFPSAEILEQVVKKYGAVEGAKQTLGRLEGHLMKLASAKNGSFIKVGERDLLIVRMFDAPRELVFRAWSKPEHLSRWFAPDGCTMPSCEMEFRAGGKLRFIFQAADGTEYPFEGSYVQIVEPSKIVFQGNIHDVPGQDVFTIVTFAEHEDKTKLVVHQAYAMESDATRGASMGWTQTLNHLEEFVANRL